MTRMRVVSDLPGDDNWTICEFDVDDVDIEASCFVEIRSVNEYRVDNLLICLRPGHGIRFEKTPTPAPFYY